jgi:hypothetical protein
LAGGDLCAECAMIGFQSARFVQTRPLPINVTMPR